MLQQTHNIPVILVVVADPVGSGFVTSLARPGGNVTGFTPIVRSLGGKRVVEHPFGTIKAGWSNLFPDEDAATSCLRDGAGPRGADASSPDAHQASVARPREYTHDPIVRRRQTCSR